MFYTNHNQAMVQISVIKIMLVILCIVGRFMRDGVLFEGFHHLRYV